MKFIKGLLYLSLLISFSSQLFAIESTRLVTVLIKKGTVKARLPGGIITDVQVNSTLPEGSELITSVKSFVKIIFLDKSVINLGPESSIIITALPKAEAGIINLIKGQIRAEVTKNYMEMTDKSKSKLFIQTKTAAMGIRGTDFQVNYNPINQNSSLIVFEGKVIMAHIDRAIQNEAFNQAKLEMIVSNNTAVLVKQGQISAVNLNISDRALIPSKLAPKQLDALKENTTGLDENTNSKKIIRDITPPGIDSAAFINKSTDALKSELNEAKGYFNDKTNEYKPSAGSIIDLKTVNLIAPPTDAKFDHSTKTFVISENFGKVDERSGAFKAPKGYVLSNEGFFKPVLKNQTTRLENGKKEIEIGLPNNPEGSTPGTEVFPSVWRETKASSTTPVLTAEPKVILSAPSTIQSPTIIKEPAPTFEAPAPAPTTLKQPAEILTTQPIQQPSEI